MFSHTEELFQANVKWEIKTTICVLLLVIVYMIKYATRSSSSKHNLCWRLNRQQHRLQKCSDTVVLPSLLSSTATQSVVITSPLAAVSVEQIKNACRRPGEGEIGPQTPLRPSVLTFWPIVKVLILLFRAH